MTISRQKETFLHLLSMYDADSNGWIDLAEMTRIVKSIYSMMGPDQVRGWATDLKFVKKLTRPNLRAKEFYTLKTRKSRLFLPAINSKNASLSVIRPSFG